MKLFSNIGLILFGAAQLSLALILRWAGLGRKNSYRLPYTFGFLENLRIAVARYTTRDLLQRMVFIVKKPTLALQYFRVLNREVNVFHCYETSVRVGDLIASHDVLVDHEHHRMRVAIAEFDPYHVAKRAAGPIIVVNRHIMDGHHRVAAILEGAGPDVKIPVLLYSTSVVGRFSNRNPNFQQIPNRKIQ